MYYVVYLSTIQIHNIESRPYLASLYFNVNKPEPYLSLGSDDEGGSESRRETFMSPLHTPELSLPTEINVNLDDI